MRPVLFVFLLTILFIAPASLRAQSVAEQEISQLQNEIARREVQDRSENLPQVQRAYNRERLQEAREKLERARATLVDKETQAQISALQDYRDSLGDSMTPEEREGVDAALRKLGVSARGNANRSRSSVNLPLNNGHADGKAEPTQPASVPAIYRGPLSSPAAEARAYARKSAPFEIISPLDQYDTELPKMEVFVQLDDQTISTVPLKWSVTSKGTTFASGTFAIAAGRATEKVAVPLRIGENEIAISHPTHTSLSRSITVTRESVKLADDDKPKTEEEKKAEAKAVVDHSKTPFTRAIVGLEQAAAASASPEQKLFLEFNLTAPIFRKGSKPLDAPLWLWLNPRITSLPQTISGSVADFATSAGFTSPFTSGKVNDIVQGFEFLGGVEVPIKLNNRRVTGAIDSGFGPETKVRFGLSLLAGAGMSTPFDTQKTLQVFKVNQTVIDRFPAAAGKEFIAFTSGDRNRFFRQYYGGLRLKSYYVKHMVDAHGEPLPGSDEALDNVFPGILDVTVGQNEAVTGGKLRGMVFRVEGIYPLPFISGDKKGSIYAFGSAQMKLTHAKTIPPIILQPPDATVVVPGTNVLLQELPPRDADHYRIGVGVDLIRLIKKDNGDAENDAGKKNKDDADTEDDEDEDKDKEKEKEKENNRRTNRPRRRPV